MELRFNLLTSPTAVKVAERFDTTSKALKESTLPKTLPELVGLGVGRLHGCGLCVDAHTKEAAAAGETALRLNLVTAWRHTNVFTDAEQVTLALAEGSARLGDHSASDEPGPQVRKHYNDDQVGSPGRLAALSNAATRMNVIANNPRGSYEPGVCATMSDPRARDRQGDLG